MPDLPHLRLLRVESELPRRRGRFGFVPDRSFRRHGSQLKGQVDGVLDSYRRQARPPGITPRLILRIQLDSRSTVDEKTWERAGLTLLSADENRTLILFSSDEALTEFTERLDLYRKGPRGRRKSAPHTQIFAAIDRIDPVGPGDRIGRQFRDRGIAEPQGFGPDSRYTVDVELWDLGTAALRERAVAELRDFIASRQGRVTDHYIGESLVLIRAHCSGMLIRNMLLIDTISTLDLPPQPTLTIGEYLELDTGAFPAIAAPSEDSPGIGVIDSGVTSAHPMLAPAIGEATVVPLALGDSADAHGHGTKVAGLALYGDVESCIQARRFAPALRVYSARVTNARNEFDDDKLITTQMRDAITYFQQTYGCRVFNISLGDRNLIYRAGKVGPWASVLDSLSRELNVVIVVSAGNYNYAPMRTQDENITEYPGYLLRPEARIIEPATASTALTVGSLSHSNQIPPGFAQRNVAFQPIAVEIGAPSPFTRSGPGLGGSIKPDLVHYGGNLAYDGLIRRVRDHTRELAVISLNREYLQRLFATDSGTSFAAPRVSHMAATLVGAFPQASANLIRALLALSAEVPESSARILRTLDRNAVLRVCGYGVPDITKARFSDENRVVLFADASIGLNNFHIYEVPMTEEFTRTIGTRRISTALAYDPPVRHSRFDYLGATMSFRLIRGKSLQEITEAFRRRLEAEGRVDRLTSTRFDCEMEPKPQARERGTLQKAMMVLRQNPLAEYGDTYYLVVRCERRWAGDEHAPQRYAVALSIEHTSQVNLYARIEQRVRAGIRIRA